MDSSVLISLSDPGGTMKGSKHRAALWPNPVPDSKRGEISGIETKITLPRRIEPFCVAGLMLGAP